MQQDRTFTRLQHATDPKLSPCKPCVLCFWLNKSTTRALFSPAAPSVSHHTVWIPELIVSVWKQTLVDEFVEHSRCIHSHGVSASSMGSAAGKPGSARLYRCVILSTPTHTELKLDSMRIADGIVHLPALFLPRCFLTLPADNLLLSSLLAVLLGLSCRVTSLTQPPCVMSRWMGTEHT